MVLNVGAIKKEIARATQGQVSRRKLSSVVSGRTELANRRTAKKVARQKQARLIESGMISGGDWERGSALKQGILGMADASLLDDARYAKLQAMDADKLDALYQSNDLIFEVYFDYGNADKSEDGVITMDRAQKTRDADFLIDLYQKTYKVAL